MTYFHTGIRTIIGAKSFHCPVRDGKEWDQLAMVIRHNLLTKCLPRGEHFIEFIEQISFNLDYCTVRWDCDFLNASTWHNFLETLSCIKVIGSSRTSN